MDVDLSLVEKIEVFCDKQCSNPECCEEYCQDAIDYRRRIIGNTGSMVINQ